MPQYWAYKSIIATSSDLMKLMHESKKKMLFLQTLWRRILILLLDFVGPHLKLFEFSAVVVVVAKSADNHSDSIIRE